MDVFAIRESLIQDYRNFTSSFVQIRDERVRAHVQKLLETGHQWPDPWLSLNPNFASGGTVTDLIADGLLHEDSDPVFRKKLHQTDAGHPLRLHQHQRRAIELARERVAASAKECLAARDSGCRSPASTVQAARARHAELSFGRGHQGSARAAAAHPSSLGRA